MIRGRKRRRKRCRFCARLFNPDPRLKGRQYACATPECQGQRKAANQRRWLVLNPGYFKGRYPKTRLWLAAHPGYLACYRREHPEALQRDSEGRRRRHRIARSDGADIQVAKSLQGPVSKALAPFLEEPSGADMQDSILPEMVLTALFSASYLRRARADIQDPIATPPPADYAPRHGSAAKTSPQSGSSPQGAGVL
jgi:hypothetical protein